MFIAEIQLDHPGLVLVPTLKRLPETTVTLENQFIADEETYFLFFTVSDGDFERFDEAVEEDWTVSDSTVIIDGNDFRVYRMRLCELERLVLPQAARLGIHVLHAVGGMGGWQATLQIPEWSRFHEFQSFCASREVTLSVQRLYEPEGERGGKFGLTAAQREILVTSHEAGYFKEPRQASLDQIATTLGISSSAASGRLRRALDTLVSETVAKE